MCKLCLHSDCKKKSINIKKTNKLPLIANHRTQKIPWDNHWVNNPGSGLYGLYIITNIVIINEKCSCLFELSTTKCSPYTLHSVSYNDTTWVLRYKACVLEPVQGVMCCWSGAFCLVKPSALLFAWRICSPHFLHQT